MTSQRKSKKAVAPKVELASTLPGDLYAQVREVLQQARQQAQRSVNQAMVLAYWQIGQLIVQAEQGAPSGPPMAPRPCRRWRPG
jgi:F0F1-type ATP synthase membrane subunit b/b'